MFWLESTDCRKGSIRDQISQEGGTISHVRSWDFHNKDPTAGVSETIRCPINTPAVAMMKLSRGGAMAASALQGQLV